MAEGPLGSSSNVPVKTGHDHGSDVADTPDIFLVTKLDDKKIDTAVETEIGAAAAAAQAEATILAPPQLAAGMKDFADMMREGNVRWADIDPNEVFASLGWMESTVEEHKLQLPRMSHESFKGFREEFERIARFWFGERIELKEELKGFTSPFFGERSKLAPTGEQLASTNYLAGLLWGLRPVWTLGELHKKDSSQNYAVPVALRNGARDMMSFIVENWSVGRGQLSRRQARKVYHQVDEASMISKVAKITNQESDAERLVKVIMAIAREVSRHEPSEDVQKAQARLIQPRNVLLHATLPIVSREIEIPAKNGKGRPTKKVVQGHQTCSVTQKYQRLMTEEEVSLAKVWNQFSRVDNWSTPSMRGSAVEEINAAIGLVAALRDVSQRVHRELKKRKTNAFNACPKDDKKKVKPEDLAAKVEEQKKKVTSNVVTDMCVAVFRKTPAALMLIRESIFDCYRSKQDVLDDEDELQSEDEEEPEEF